MMILINATKAFSHTFTQITVFIGKYAAIIYLNRYFTSTRHILSLKLQAHHHLFRQFVSISCLRQKNNGIVPLFFGMRQIFTHCPYCNSYIY